MRALNQIVFAAAMAIVASTMASAQTTGQPASQPQPPAAPTLGGSRGWIDFGVRTTRVSGDEDRFERYRDVGDGLFVEQFGWNRETARWTFGFEANNAGRRDQRFRGEVEQIGRLRGAFEWDQIPLKISRDTRTPYVQEGPGVFRLSDAFRIGVETGQRRLSDIVALAEVFETGYRRQVAAGDVWFTPRPNLDLRARVSSSDKAGWMPYGASFGFNLAVEVPTPIQTRTTDARLELEWARDGSVLRLNYDGSWFGNDIERLIWDNPIKFTDSTNPSAYIAGNGTSSGRLALPPSNQMHTVGGTASFALPRRSRFTGTVAFGAATQNGELPPHTINSVIPEIPLSRERADADAQILVANLNFTSRPWRHVGLKARYRLHDRDNRTEHFEVVNKVRMDQLIEPFDPGGLGKTGPEFFSIRRQTFDVEASYMPLTFTSVRGSYAHVRADRTFRVFEETTENIFRASVDTTGNQWVSVRAQVERANRDGHELDLHALALVGEQPGMRHFDIADRERTRFTAMANVTPVAYAGFNAAITVGKDDFPESYFGLRDNDHRVYSVGFDATAPGLLASLSYANEDYETFQLSRQANPGVQFNDPTRDWSTDANERVNSVLASLELPAVAERLNLRLTYDFSRSRTDYVYGLGTPIEDRTLPEGSPITALPAVQQLPRVSNEIHSARLDTRYFLTRQLAVGVVYWYERYRVEDFALGDETIRRIDLPAGLLMYYRYRPYDAHSVWGRISYQF